MEVTEAVIEAMALDEEDPQALALAVRQRQA